MKSWTVRWAHIWHLTVLVAFVSVVFAGRSLDQGLSIGSALLSLPPHLYRWLPVLAGVALATRGLGAASSRHAVEVAVAGVALMLVLDVGGEILSARNPTELVTFDGENVTSASGPTVGDARSWVLTGVRAARGELHGVSEQREGSYPIDHPRAQVATALVDGSMILALVGILGILLGIGSLLDEHVIFRRPKGERIVHMVLAWSVGAAISGYVAARSIQAMVGALLRGDPLLSILVPAVITFAAGLVWWVAAVEWQQPSRPEVISRAA